MLGKTIDYRSSGGSSFIINNRINYHAVSPFYYIQVVSVDGQWSSDISYESHPIPNSVGEKSGDVFRRGKTLTFSGTIWGRGFSEIYSGADFLQGMLAELATRKLVFTPWNHNVQLYYNAKPYQDLSILEQFTAETPRLDYTFALRCDDPRSRLLSNDAVFPTNQ